MRSVKDFSNSSSDIDGSRHLRNVSQGRRGQRPQCSKPSFSEQHRYTGQSFISELEVQNGLPPVCLQPGQSLRKYGQSSQCHPHGGADSFSTMFCSFLNFYHKIYTTSVFLRISVSISDVLNFSCQRYSLIPIEKTLSLNSLMQSVIAPSVKYINAIIELQTFQVKLGFFSSGNYLERVSNRLFIFCRFSF